MRNPEGETATSAPNHRFWQSLGAGLLLLACLCVGLALWSSQRQAAIQGPWGLAVLPGNHVWLSVNDALWRLDAQGQRQQVVPAAQAGLAGSAGILAAHPEGHLVAWSRHSPVLHVLSATDARPLRTLTPAWPAALQRHGDNAIRFAFAPDGRVAIATGGGHAVALFGPQGQHLGTTPEDTYRFTNGLWWEDGHWWTTDTNRPALVRLDDAHLAPVQRIELLQQQGRWRFVQDAIAPYHPPGATATPAGTLVRLDGGMQAGHVVDVWPDGRQTPYPLPPGSSALEPRALARLNADLLVVDGASFRILRYGPDRQWLGEWGDEGVRATLQAQQAAIGWWRAGYYASLAGAVLWFVLGLACALRAQKIQAQAQLRAHRPDLAQRPCDTLGIAGQARPTPWQQARLLLRLNLPFLPWILLALLLPRALRDLLPLLLASQPARIALAVLLPVLMLPILVWLLRDASRRSQTDPAFEPLVNLRALRLLARPGLFWPHSQAGEMPRETLVLGLRWVVLTNQRLLVFKANARDARLNLACPRGTIRKARAVALRHGPRWYHRVQGWLVPGAVYLRLVLADGRTVEGMASCAQTAHRLVALVRNAPAPATPSGTQPTTPADRRRALRDALVSFVVPGVGQYLQRRRGTALVVFTIWGALLLPGAYVAWAAWWPAKDVSFALRLQLALTLLTIHLLAAWDAWRLAPAPKSGP